MADPTYSDLFKHAQTRLGDFLTPAVRLGVTGLSRAGKTVFITALVRNLVSGGRLPFFAPEAEQRIVRAYLEPQPDDSVPRFDYEAHLGDLAGLATVVAGKHAAHFRVARHDRVPLAPLC